MEEGLPLSVAAREVLAERYLRRDRTGQVVESPGELFARVAAAIASVESRYGQDPTSWALRFEQLMRDLTFLPNSPTLMNAGTEIGVLSACFVLPIEDSLRSIFGTLADAALIHQAGGGTGFSFSRIRPAGDLVGTTGGRASGPLSFLRLYDTAADVMREGGRRRAANMAVLEVSHPDIEAFVAAKHDLQELHTFNLSVGATDRFMRSVVERERFELVNPRTRRSAGHIDARELFEQICEEAWRSGDPGLVFLDRINRANVLRSVGRIEATNPCGEVPLLPGESCNLGSINLARLVERGCLDRRRLGEVVTTAVRFLDDVIDAATYPTPETEAAAHGSRKIGLGVMGLAELLALRGVAYDSELGIRTAANVIRTIAGHAVRASEQLAEERGPFPLWEVSTLARRGRRPRRNAQLLSIAPTGTISLLAGTTAGIEPVFAVVYSRQLLGAAHLEVNRAFETVVREAGLWSTDLLDQLAATGSVKDIDGLPRAIKRVFRSALEMAPAWHVRMQAAVQRHVDAAVSKTVNLPNDATPRDIGNLYRLAWRSGVKGITVYRDGSRPDQVQRRLAPAGSEAAVAVAPTFSGGCSARECHY
ncbi:adenosylcobalamin-dependent ribonucleoside-diphosphate reductase [Rhabdothermincola sediminis]|uniref:adenosylcobalamin-dependent ribonucleoside-diphosphate reductase n=1 Tax=Rhabdothermincola sediminis TaxID=2751370 RepID=UPI001AA04EB2|nr:adenosylcobalamin-dependent ribonucleoside-diphosphate reductase [Rhabdothermincola sediminis]